MTDWASQLGYVEFAFALQIAFGAYTVCYSHWAGGGKHTARTNVSDGTQKMEAGPILMQALLVRAVWTVLLV